MCDNKNRTVNQESGVLGTVYSSLLKMNMQKTVFCSKTIVTLRMKPMFIEGNTR